MYTFFVWYSCFSEIDIWFTVHLQSTDVQIFKSQPKKTCKLVFHNYLSSRQVQWVVVYQSPSLSSHVKTEGTSTLRHGGRVVSCQDFFLTFSKFLKFPVVLVCIVQLGRSTLYQTKTTVFVANTQIAKKLLINNNVHYRLSHDEVTWDVDCDPT